MRATSLRALVAGPADPRLDALAAALGEAGVAVRRLTAASDPGAVVPELLAEDARERADVVVAGLLVVAAAAAERALAGRVWVVLDRLPPPLELLRAAPPEVAAVAAAVRWVVCADETARGLVDFRVTDAAKRTVVLPLDAPGAPLDAAVRGLLDRTFPAAPWARRPRPLRVAVAGHALHFLAAVTEWLRGLHDVELRIDHVRSFRRQDEAASHALVDWADTIVCEWASPVAAWYSRHKRTSQRLVVRLHRAELYSDWWHGIDADAVDQVICVSQHYARLTRELTGWPAEKIVVIPNYVDSAVLHRPKLPDAEVTFGMMGVVPRRKRLDLALDLVERIRAEDPRFTLRVKSQMPWDVAWAWRDEGERAAAQEALHRLRGSPRLADGVVLDPHGADVGLWLRSVGWMLSLSDDESFHLAPAEAMASGAVPLIRPWPGSGTIYDRRWIVGPEAPGADGDVPVADVVEAMAGLVVRVVRERRWDELREEARAHALRDFDVTAVCERFGRVLVEDLSPALLPEPGPV
jgi:glycosyltransferase involved in cell wall biosynthesis